MIGTRIRHRGDKINRRGRVSALCFDKPRAIDMRRASWCMQDSGVTCPKCLKLIAEKRGAQAEPATTPGALAEERTA